MRNNHESTDLDALSIVQRYHAPCPSLLVFDTHGDLYSQFAGQSIFSDDVQRDVKRLAAGASFDVVRTPADAKNLQLANTILADADAKVAEEESRVNAQIFKLQQDQDNELQAIHSTHQGYHSGTDYTNRTHGIETYTQSHIQDLKEDLRKRCNEIRSTAKARVDVLIKPVDSPSRFQPGYGSGYGTGPGVPGYGGAPGFGGH
jgi:hypothetical protein